MKKVAFICVHNSCRSQIAEALGKHLASDVFESYSAGTETKPQINQDAVRIMKVLYGINMELTQRSKLISDIPPVDIVITMGCNVQCPYLPCEHREDWGLEDPSGKEDAAFHETIRIIEQKILELKERLECDIDMSEKRTCSNCIGYLLPQGLTEPFECWKCHIMALTWFQYSTGSYGVKCRNCGMQAAAGLNMECELDREIYLIQIDQQSLSNEKILELSKLVGKNALQTKRELSTGPIELEGNLSYVWTMKQLLMQKSLSFSLRPNDIEERYFYACKCGYFYERIKQQEKHNEKAFISDICNL